MLDGPKHVMIPPDCVLELVNQATKQVFTNPIGNVCDVHYEPLPLEPLSIEPVLAWPFHCMKLEPQQQQQQQQKESGDEKKHRKKRRTGGMDRARRRERRNILNSAWYQAWLNDVIEESRRIAPGERRSNRLKWSPEESHLLEKLVSVCGSKDWSFVQRYIPWRSRRSCRYQWEKMETTRK